MTKKQSLNTLFHASYSLNYHLVLVTKYRRHCITAEMMITLERVAREITTAFGGEVLEFSGEADHVHILLSLNPKVALSGFINAFKSAASRRVRSQFAEHLAKFYWRERVFWSRTYCVISCGGAPIDILKAYIAQQERPAKDEHDRVAVSANSPPTDLVGSA